VAAEAPGSAHAALVGRCHRTSRRRTAPAIQAAPAAALTTTAYDLAGNATTVTGPLNYTTTYAYDAAGGEVRKPLGALVL
jgi:hypothetical protein